MSSARYLVFRPDRTALAALPIAHVIETMRPLRVEPLAGAPASVRGAAIVRGRATPVIDAGALFGGALAGDATRWIAFRVGERSAILAVHDVLGVQSLAIAERTAPPLLARAAITELATLDGELLAVLEATRLVDEAVWRGVDAR